MRPRQHAETKQSGKQCGKPDDARDKKGRFINEIAQDRCQRRAAVKQCANAIEKFYRGVEQSHYGQAQEKNAEKSRG
jgi:hypothetical protein